MVFTSSNIGGKTVLKGVKRDDPSLHPFYYYAPGDILFFLQSANEGVVTEAVNGLLAPAARVSAVPGFDPGPETAGDKPGSHTEKAGRAWPFTLTPDGWRDRPAYQQSQFGGFLIDITQVPREPSCVGEPHFRQKLSATVYELNSIVPTPLIVVLPLSTIGSFSPRSQGGSATVEFAYAAERLGIDQLTLQVTSLVYQSSGAFNSEVFNIVGLPTTHCLNCIWDDGPRTMSIQQGGDLVRATIETGTLSCGETGTAFEGTLAYRSDLLAGSSMKVCNYRECVTAGLLPRTTLTDYTLRVSEDGRTLSGEWTRQLNDLVYDDSGRLVGCPLTGTQRRSVSFTRLSFGPDISWALP